MTRVQAYHTTSVEYPPTHRNVYHNNDACPYGKDIKPWHRVDGTGGHDLCKECAKL